MTVRFSDVQEALLLRLLILLATLFLFTGIIAPAPASAACTLPNQITNGQVADATVVMGNLNALTNCANSKVSPAGTPAAGNLPVFSGPGEITNGDLSGDCTTSGTLAITCTKSNGTPLGYFATGTDGGQLTGTVSVGRFNNGLNADAAHFLRGDGVWAIPPGTGGGGGATTPVVRAANIQSSSGTSYTVTWPTGTVAGDVVIIFGEHGWTFQSPAGWNVLDNQSGQAANGLVIAKVMTSSDITAGSVTITTSSSYNGVLAAVTIDGTTMSGMRSPAAFVRSSTGPSAGGSVKLFSFTPLPTDLMLAFVGVRAGSNVTLSSDFTSLAAINGANASGVVGRFTGSLGVLGLDQSASSSAAGTGYYTALLFVR